VITQKKQNKQATPKLGTPSYTMLGKSATDIATPKKITSNVIRKMYDTIQAGRSSFRTGGENYTIAGLASELKPLMNPSDRRRFLAGDKVSKMRPPTSGSGRMDIVFADDGALVSKKKRPSKTNNKKSRTGSTKYGCGLFK